MGALIGTLSGAIIGAVGAQSEAEIDAKRAMLAAAWADAPYAQRLTEALRAGAGAGSGGPSPAWVVTVSITRLESMGHGRDKPFELSLRTELAVSPPGAAAATTLAFDALSPAALTADGWRADGARALREALDACVQSLAAQALTSMRQLPGAPPRPAAPA